jgi:hypothetical protein
VAVLGIEDRKRAGAAAVLFKDFYEVATPQSVAYCKAICLIKTSARVYPSDGP